MSEESKWSEAITPELEAYVTTRILMFYESLLSGGQIMPGTTMGDGVVYNAELGRKGPRLTIVKSNDEPTLTLEAE